MADTTVVEHKRATVRPDKGDTVAALVESFTSSTAAVLTEYRGLTVKQISELRRALGADTTYAVVKNTLTKIAAQKAGLTGLDALLAGPTAVAFVGGDPVNAAKSLREFAKAHPALVVKGGVMDGKSLTADEVKKLADLESREVLLAKLAGAMKGSLTQAVRLFAAPLSQAARALGALEAKAQQDPAILAGGAGTPAPAAEDAVPAAAETPLELDATVEAPEADVAPDATVEAPEADVAQDATAETTEAPAAEASTDSETSETSPSE